jgi:hypothetical protein
MSPPIQGGADISEGSQGTRDPQMSPSIGFVLATFNKRDQTLFLCERLTSMFGAPPIAIHHDFSKSAIDTSLYPPNVRFVDRWRSTRWGSITVIEAFLSAYQLLYETPGFGDPDWVVPLSSTDYPIQTADRILSDLQNASVDAFMDLRPIHDYGGIYIDEALGEDPFNQPRYHQGAFNRYVAIPVLPLDMARQYRIPVELLCLKWKWLISRLTPFHDGFQCYGGDAWFIVNRRVAKLFLTDDDRRRTLLKHYSSRSTPEESFWHTLVGNTPEIRVSTQNLRYSDWKGCFAHPRTLGRESLPALLASSAHYARKFAFDPAFLDELDEAVAAKEAHEWATVQAGANMLS